MVCAPNSSHASKILENLSIIFRMDEQGFHLPKSQYPKLSKYMHAMHLHPSFKATRSLPDNVMYGYRQLERGIETPVPHTVSDIID